MSLSVTVRKRPTHRGRECLRCRRSARVSPHYSAAIAAKSFPLFAAPSKAQQQVFVADRALTVPPSLEKLVEAVDLEPPVIFNISAIAPALSYDHMELPDDVARGMDAIKAHERSSSSPPYVLKATMRAERLSFFSRKKICSQPIKASSGSR
jgi:hypothetical protein